jgi:hypothetical protein
MLYLIAQTLGLFHESQRYDRDNFITILNQNILPENLGDFGILDPSLHLLDTFGLPYDYTSLMQFPSKVSMIRLDAYFLCWLAKIDLAVRNLRDLSVTTSRFIKVLQEKSRFI